MFKSSWLLTLFLLAAYGLQAVEVNGNLIVTGGSFTGNLSVLTTNGDLLTRAFGVPARLGLGSAGAMMYAGASGPVWSSTSGLAYDPVNGRVGIGTASPAANLDILATAGSAINAQSIASGFGMTIRNSSGSVVFDVFGDTGGFRTRNGGNFQGWFDSTPTSAYRFDPTSSGLQILTFNGTAWEGNMLLLNNAAKTVGIGPSNTSPSGTLSVFDATSTTGVSRSWIREGAGQGSSEVFGVYANNGTTKRFDITNNIITATSPFVSASTTTLTGVTTFSAVPRFNGTNTTGAGTALLGSNSPAVTNAAPYTWIQVTTSDGSTGYVPVWK